MCPEDTRTLNDVGIVGYEVVEIVIQTKAEIQQIQACHSDQANADKMDEVEAPPTAVQQPTPPIKQAEPKKLSSLINKIELLCSDSHKRYLPACCEAYLKHNKSTHTDE